MAKPKSGSPEWQEQLNAEIAKHDAEQRERDIKIDAELTSQAQAAARATDRRAGTRPPGPSVSRHISCSAAAGEHTEDIA